MANIKSSAKSARQTITRTARNRSIKAGIKSLTKKFQRIVREGGDGESPYRAVVSDLDRAVKRGVIHKNTAARRKSRLAKRLAASRPAAA